MLIVLEECWENGAWTRGLQRIGTGAFRQQPRDDLHFRRVHRELWLFGFRDQLTFLRGAGPGLAEVIYVIWMKAAKFSLAQPNTMLRTDTP